MANESGMTELLQALIERLDRWLPPPPSPVAWDAVLACRWRKHGQAGLLQPVSKVHPIRLSDLQAIDAQKSELVRNTLQFVSGFRANNVLLWGARGTGKSALIKALLNELGERGLRLIEVEKHDLVDLTDIVDLLDGLPQRFILFCDDLSFDEDEPGYKALKVVLDGSVSASADNVLIYATSNRRHLLPEFLDENLEVRRVEGEIHPGEAVDEKISLSERFGLHLSFYPFRQDDYLAIVYHWLSQFQIALDDRDTIRAEALRWGLAHGSRSGRVAWQFACDWAGRVKLAALKAGDDGG